MSEKREKKVQLSQTVVVNVQTQLLCIVAPDVCQRLALGIVHAYQRIVSIDLAGSRADNTWMAKGKGEKTTGETLPATVTARSTFTAPKLALACCVLLRSARTVCRTARTICVPVLLG